MPEKTRGLPAVIGYRPRLLILGSLPGRRSLEVNAYYGHPRNAFWRIMGELFGAGPDLAYERRLARIMAQGIALWDVLADSVRPGSLDSDIDAATATANDIGGLLRSEPTIGVVCFNGKAAAKMFARLVAPQLENGSNTPTTRVLPSTSPAHAAMPYAQKLAEWRCIQSVLQQHEE